MNLHYSLVFIFFITRLISTPLPVEPTRRFYGGCVAGLPAVRVAGLAPPHGSPTLLESIISWYLPSYPLGGYTAPEQFCPVQRYPLDERYSSHPTPMDATIPNPGPRQGTGMHR